MSAEPAPFRASTPTPSIASVGGGKKGGAKKGKKSRAASTAPSAAGDGQTSGVQWATPIQASVSDPTGLGRADGDIGTAYMASAGVGGMGIFAGLIEVIRGGIGGTNATSAGVAGTGRFAGLTEGIDVYMGTAEG